MSKTFWAIVAILIAGLLAFLFINNKGTQNLNLNGDVSSIQDTDRIVGPKNAKVVVIEYGDYQCPSCRAWQAKVEEFKSQMDGETAFVFRNFPITSAHKNAVASSRAAEAAAGTSPSAPRSASGVEKSATDRLRFSGWRQSRKKISDPLLDQRKGTRMPS